MRSTREAVRARAAAAARGACSTPVHRSTSSGRPSGSRTSVRSWATPGSASNVAAVVVPDGEVGVERAERQPAARAAAPGRCRRARPRPRRRPSSARTRPGTGRSTASNSASKASAAGIEALERRARRGVAPGELDERRARCRCRARRSPAGPARGRGAPARTRRRAPAPPAAARARRRRGRPPAPSPW